jgi:hypothetical protein
LPSSPQTMGFEAQASGCPSMPTDLPLLSISSCCRNDGKIFQRLVVGQHGVARRTQEIGVPDTDQGHHHRQIALVGRAAEMFVHSLSAGQQIGKACGPMAIIKRQADRRPQRETSANPVPERKHRSRRRIPKSPAPLGFGRQRGKMPGHRSGIAEIGDQPVARGLRIEHGFLRGEGLAGDEEKRRARVKRLQQRRKLSAIEVGDVVHGKCRMRD